MAPRDHPVSARKSPDTLPNPGIFNSFQTSALFADLHALGTPAAAVPNPFAAPVASRAGIIARAGRIVAGSIVIRAGHRRADQRPGREGADAIPIPAAMPVAVAMPVTMAIPVPRFGRLRH